MRMHNRKRLLFGTGGISLLFLLFLFLTARLQAQNESAGDACIGCHVAQFNQGVAGAFQHPPFWERQCTMCHLQQGSDWPNNSSSATLQQELTGALVSQEPLWRKQQRYNGKLLTTEHVASLDQLDSPLGYRFRVAVGEQASIAQSRSLWLGLDAQQLWNSTNHELTTANGLNGEIGEEIEILTITAISSNQVMISWSTEQPLYSWLELQELAGIETEVSAQATAVGQAEHPPLRRADDLAIEACYRCHPESSLGASHPVRLYGGRDVRIPEDLPTVDGMLTCVTCHLPHGGDGKKLLRTKDKTRLCVTCHYKYKNSSPSTMFRD